ncbi:hypothetical protein INT45_009804 [Circinella minor]|uniref:Transposase n=1 Tax=Circinella minor TaxID=1195481 RepID=A0A8H7RCM9_9FUNG|nr:hypothetical protein INT45_009804 [Circinella minor]
MNVDKPTKGKGSGKRRGKYTPASIEQTKKALLLKAVGLSTQEAALRNGIKPGTLRSRQKKHQETGSYEGRKRGRKKDEITKEIHEFFCRYVDIFPTASHEEIYKAFTDKFSDQNVSTTALKSYVQSNFRITLRSTKSLCNKNTGTNSMQVDRENYLHELYSAGINARNSVFVGETAYLINSTRTYSDSKSQNHRIAKAQAKNKVLKRREKKEVEMEVEMTFFIAFTKEKIIHQTFKVCEGVTNGDDVQKFVSYLLDQINNENIREWNIIFDDVSSDIKKLITDLVEPKGHRVFFLNDCNETVQHPADMLFDNAKLQTKRHPVNKQNPLKDAIWERLNSTIANTDPSDLKSYILSSLMCVCEDCL